MTTRIYLTDSDSEIAGYKRATLHRRGDAPSLVRAVTATATGPTSGIQLTRTSGGTALKWITPRLDGTNLTAATWMAHVWAFESSLAANAALRFQVAAYSTSVGSTALDDNGGTELTTTTSDYNRTTSVAGATTLNPGDRLVITILLDDAASPMVGGETVTFSFNGEIPFAEGDSYLTCPDDLNIGALLPQTTRDRVWGNLRDIAASERQIDQTLLDEAIDDAIRQYSVDRPRVVAGAISGDGAAFAFGLPPLWVHGLSTIEEIEHPAGEQTRQILDPHDYEIRIDSLGSQPRRHLYFLTMTPASGTDNILVRHTTRHVHTDELDSIPPDDLGALCWLAASFAANKMAAKMAASGDATMTADSVNHRDGEQRWRAVAKTCREQYQALIGRGGEVAAGGIVGEWDTNLAPFGGDRLFHRRRWR